MSAAIQIESVLKSCNRPMYLHEIREAIVEQFGAWHSESAISARIRDSVRPKLLAQGVSLIGKAPKGKSAWQYSLSASIPRDCEWCILCIHPMEKCTC